MDGWMNGWMDDGWMIDGWMDDGRTGWMDGMDGWADRQTDRRTDGPDRPDTHTHT